MNDENKTMTIKDFVTEAAVLPYSKEFFDVMKEASEIQLMELHLESNDFIVENPELLTEQASLFSEFFTEAAGDDKSLVKVKSMDDEAANGMKDKVLSKIKAGFKKVLGWFVKAFKAVWSFLKSVYAKITTWNDNRKVMKAEIARLKNIKATEETRKAFIAKMDKFFGSEEADDEGTTGKMFPDAKEFIDELKRLGASPVHVKRAEKWLERSTFNPIITVPGFLMNTSDLNRSVGKIFDEMKPVLGSKVVNGHRTFKKMDGTAIVRKLNKLAGIINASSQMKEVAVPSDGLKTMIDELEAFNTEFTKTVEEIKSLVEGKKEDMNTQNGHINAGFGNVLRALTEAVGKYNETSAKAIMSLREQIAQREAAYKRLHKFLKEANDSLEKAAA